jgi:hypothetical protein
MAQTWPFPSARLRPSLALSESKTRGSLPPRNDGVLIEGTNLLRIVAMESQYPMRFRRLAAKGTVADNTVGVQMFVLRRCLSAELM